MRPVRTRRLAVAAFALSVLGSTLGAVTTTAPVHAAFGGTPVLAYAHWPVGETAALWTASPTMASRVKRVSSTAYNVGAPSVSQDGTKIAYVAWNDSASYMQRIFVVDRAGTTGPVLWTLPAAPFSDSSPVFAPDRSALYFVRADRSTGASRIFRVTAARGTPTAVPNTEGATAPTVSPDGRYIAFERSGSIWVVQKDGKDPFRLLTGTTTSRHSSPRWSPDGKRISTIREGTTNVVYIGGTSSSAGNGNVASYAASTVVSAAGWSNGGGYLYYSLHAGANDQYSANLRRVPAQLGATPTKLTDNGPQDPYDFQPALGGGSAPTKDSTKPTIGLVVEALATQSTRLSITGSNNDVARYLLRYAPGTTPPATPGSGTPAYTGLRKTRHWVTGLTPGASYAFSAFAVDWSGNVSLAATRVVTTQRVTAVSATAVKPLIVYGAATQLTGKITDATSQAPLTGRPVKLFARRTTATTWTHVASATSDGAGAVSATHSPAGNTDYQWRYAGDASAAAAASPIVRVKVRTTVSAAFTAYTITAGGTTELRGGVAPAQPGERVILQRLLSGTWSDVTTAGLSSTSRYRFVISGPTAGTKTYRVIKRYDAHHATGISPSRTLTIS